MSEQILNILIPVLIILGACILGFLIYVSLKQKKHENVYESRDMDNADGFLVKNTYIRPKYINFYKTLKEILPSNVSIQTKVTFDTFVIYNGSNDYKKKFLNNYSDIVLFFEDDFKPFLAFDLNDFDVKLERMDIMRKDIFKVLNYVNIPCIALPARDSYDKKELQNMIFNALSPEILERLGVKEEGNGKEK